MMLLQWKSKTAVALVSENDLSGTTSLIVKKRPVGGRLCHRVFDGGPRLVEIGGSPPVRGFLIPLKGELPTVLERP